MKWIAVTGLAIILAALLCIPVAGSGPLPDYQKILQIHLKFQDSGYSVTGMEVRYGDAPNLDIKNGILKGTIQDAKGNELKSFLLREPGVAYGDIAGPDADSLIGYTETSAGGEMIITVPYLAGMQKFSMSDSRDGALLVSADLDPAVAGFCTAFPGDPDCLVRITPSKSDAPDTGTSLVLAILFCASVIIAAAMAIWTIRRRTSVTVPEKQVVLIVDDDPDMVEAIHELLVIEGYGTLMANSGKECLAVLAKQVPDLVLLDVGMGPMDGWQTLAQIKKDPAFRTIPVLMLTGHRLTPDAARHYHICIDDYLMKPFQPDELYTAIGSILERQHTLKETLALARKAGVDKEKFCELARLSRRISVDKKILGILDVPRAVPATADLDTLDDMLVVDYINVKTRDQEKRAEQLRQEINTVFRSKGLPELRW
jgi:two-component system, OmpR family, response regulator